MLMLNFFAKKISKLIVFRLYKKMLKIFEKFAIINNFNKVKDSEEYLLELQKFLASKKFLI